MSNIDATVARLMPKLPSHPEPRIMAWTGLELEAISAYGKQCFEAALRKELAVQGEVVIALRHAIFVLEGMKLGAGKGRFGDPAYSVTYINESIKTLKYYTTPQPAIAQPADKAPLQEEIIAKLEVLLEAKNQSWKTALEMLSGIFTEFAFAQPVQPAIASQKGSV